MTALSNKGLERTRSAFPPLSGPRRSTRCSTGSREPNAAPRPEFASSSALLQR